MKPAEIQIPTKEELELLAELEAAGTPAPWQEDKAGRDGALLGLDPIMSMEDVAPMGDAFDIPLALAARNALPGLLELIRQQRAVLAELRADLDIAQNIAGRLTPVRMVELEELARSYRRVIESDYGFSDGTFSPHYRAELDRLLAVLGAT